MKKLLYFLLVLLMLVAGIFLYYSEPDISVQQLKDKYTDNESRFVTVQNMEVHFKIEGEGNKSLVLLHGTGASLHTWDGWVAALKDSFQIIRLDLPAYGITGPFEDRNYSLDNYMNFLDEFIRGLDIDQFALAGNSFGGLLAWNYAYLFPEKISELILVDASGYPSEKDIGIFTLAKNPLTAQILKKITPRSFIHNNLKEVYGNDSLISDSTIDRYWNMARREGNRQAFVDRVNTEYDDRSHLIREISIPTLILWGDQDTWTAPENAYKFDKDLPNSTMIMYQGTGHIVMEEYPQVSASDVLDFLSKSN